MNFRPFFVIMNFCVGLTFTIVALFSSVVVQASATSEHPEKPFLSSLPALLLAPSVKFHPEVDSLTLYPERSQLVLDKNKNLIHYNYKIQSDANAPMVIVIPGIGGLANSSSALYSAEMAYSLGYSIITIPSTTHWSFALAASTTGRTGHLPADAKDLYQVIKAIKTKLEESHSIHPAQWGLVGASYGALDGSFLMAQDLDEKIFNFQFLLIINPPLDRTLATAKVDEYYSYGKLWPERKKSNLERFMVQRMLSATRGINPIDNYSELEHAFPVDEKELAWLMAKLFRDVVLKSAGIGNLVEQSQNRSSTTSGFSQTILIKDYLREKLYKKYYGAQNEEDFVKLENESNLSYALSKNNAELMKTKKIILFHSTNDYLSFPEGQEILDQLAVEKYIYPYGGHLGILSDKTVLQQMQDALIRLKTTH